MSNEYTWKKDLLNRLEVYGFSLAFTNVFIMSFYGLLIASRIVHNRDPVICTYTVFLGLLLRIPLIYIGLAKTIDYVSRVLDESYRVYKVSAYLIIAYTVLLTIHTVLYGFEVESMLYYVSLIVLVIGCIIEALFYKRLSVEVDSVYKTIYVASILIIPSIVLFRGEYIMYWFIPEGIKYGVMCRVLREYSRQYI